MLRLNGLSITVLYEGGGRQQVTIPGPFSGRIQRRKEIPEATRDGRKTKTHKYTWMEGWGARVGVERQHWNREGKHIKGSRK